MGDEKTPPEITTGSFVSWSNGKGRVDLIVTSGKVPGVDSDIEATSDSPAARVVVWADGKPTREKIAASTHTLRRIAPLDKGESKADPVAALVALGAEHARVCEEMHVTAALTGDAIKTAYDRGLMSWPGSDVTTLSPTEWALARAEHLCKAARGEVEETNDDDLLPSEDEVVLSAEEIDSMLASIEEASAGEAPTGQPADA